MLAASGNLGNTNRETPLWGILNAARAEPCFEQIAATITGASDTPMRTTRMLGTLEEAEKTTALFAPLSGNRVS